MRDCLLQVLTQPQSYEVFCLPGKDALEIEVLRQEIVNQLRVSTAMILGRMGASKPAHMAYHRPAIRELHTHAEQHGHAAKPHVEEDKDYSLDTLEERLNSSSFKF